MPNVFPCLIHQQDSGIAHRKKHMSVHIQHTHKETLIFADCCLGYVWHICFSLKNRKYNGIQHTNRKYTFWWGRVKKRMTRSSCSYGKSRSKAKKVKTPILCNENSKHGEKLILHDLQVDHVSMKICQYIWFGKQGGNTKTLRRMMQKKQCQN